MPADLEIQQGDGLVETICCAHLQFTLGSVDRIELAQQRIRAGGRGNIAQSLQIGIDRFKPHTSKVDRGFESLKR